jgi:carboxylesterase type B
MATVFVAQGALKGRTVTTTAGITYYSFQGIPYAKPPVGPLRFQVRRGHFSIIPTTYSNLYYIGIQEFEHREVVSQT